MTRYGWFETKSKGKCNGNNKSRSLRYASQKRDAPVEMTDFRVQQKKQLQLQLQLQLQKPKQISPLCIAKGSQT